MMLLSSTLPSMQILVPRPGILAAAVLLLAARADALVPAAPCLRDPFGIQLGPRCPGGGFGKLNGVERRLPVTQSTFWRRRSTGSAAGPLNAKKKVTKAGGGSGGGGGGGGFGKKRAASKDAGGQEQVFGGGGGGGGGEEDVFELGGGMDVADLMKMLEEEGGVDKLESMGIEVVDEIAVSGEGLYGGGDVEDLDERADCETSIMSHAKTVPMPRKGTASLREEGVVILEKVLSAHAARDLRAEVLEERERAQQGDFSDILSPIGRAGGQRRFDLQLPLMDSVVSALGELLAKDAPLGSMLDEVVGPGGELRELAAFVSMPGCRQQVTHSDTTWTEDPALFTAFVALQDITPAMGPTRFIPGSHTKEAHGLFDGVDTKDELLASSACSFGPTATGDAAVYDSRLLHCGGENSAEDDEKGQRVIFYVSFMSEGAPKGSNNVQSLRSSLRGEYSLKSLRTEVDAKSA